VRIRLDSLHVISCEDVVGGGERRGPISNGLPVTVATCDEKKRRKISTYESLCVNKRTQDLRDGSLGKLTYVGLRLDG